MRESFAQGADVSERETEAARRTLSISSHRSGTEAQDTTD
jgi:hypothetical protein